MLEVQTKSSLDLYQNCFVKIGIQSYLCDNDFRSSRLKLLARTKTIPLKKYLNRMNTSQTDVCDLCNAEVGDDLEHVFFDCPVYDEIRLKFSSLFNPEPLLHYRKVRQEDNRAAPIHVFQLNQG